jgi:DNA-binding PadR family transcriptional regulator
MSLKHALLGLLTYQPMTGYELKQFFDSTVKHFWNAELSQIYPTLKALEEHGFVDKQVAVQESRPNRKVYSITDSGREEFQRWAHEPMPASDQRDAFLIKVFFGTELPTEDMLVLLRRQMEEHQKLLAFDATVMRERIRHGSSSEAHFSTKHGLYWTLTLEMSMAYRRAYIQWCEDSMRMLEESLLEEGPSLLTPEFAEHEDHRDRAG